MVKAIPLLFCLAIAGCHIMRSREPGPRDDALVVAVISDLNSSYGSTRYDPEVTTALAWIQELRPDLVLLAGDMVAGQRPALSDDNVRAMWSAFDSVVAAPLRRAGIPFAFTLGNHDGSAYPAHARDRRLAADYWNDPAHRPRLQFIDDTNFPRYYTFRARDVFFVVLDASTGELHADSAQLQWLRMTLSSPAARSAAQRIVLGHVPLYAVAEGRNQRGEVQSQPDSLRAILEAGRVRMHVSGHHHAYYPGRRGTLELLHAGAVGSGPRPLIGSSEPAYKSFTILRIDGDAIDQQSWRIDGGQKTLVDPRTLPARIDGINGYVERQSSSGWSGSPGRRAAVRSRH